MAISVFPAGGGEFVTNDFVVDMNDTSNNVIDLGRSYAEGAYDISLATGDSSFDIYAIDADGNSVGYTNDATLVCSAGFTQLAILGVSQTERLTFAFSGASNDATAEGTATGGGAYLENATPTDLPNQDDTTTVTGGNFASDVQIFFESGATSTAAKNITRNDSTELIVTRPDALDPDLDPWSLRAVNPGIPEPTGTDANILADVIDAGALPVWVTTSPLTEATINTLYSETLEATDADGAVTYSITSGTLPTGLSLDSATGEITGTPTSGSETFTVTATDEGGNANSRQFELNVAVATGGTVTRDGNFTIHTFDVSDDFEPLIDLTNIEYLVVAGGGGGGLSDENERYGAGGGAGGLRTSVAGNPSGGGASAESPISTLSAGSYPVVVGAGGAVESNGSNSSFASVTCTGGGGAEAGPASTSGADGTNQGADGGSGGGGEAGQFSSPVSRVNPGGSGTPGEGFAGGDGFFLNGGQGGGAGAPGERQPEADDDALDGIFPEGQTFNGVQNDITGSLENYAQGGNAGANAPSTPTMPGAGGRGTNQENLGPNFNAESGQDGIVIVRYAA